MGQWALIVPAKNRGVHFLFRPLTRHAGQRVSLPLTALRSVSKSCTKTIFTRMEPRHRTATFFSLSIPLFFLSCLVSIVSAAGQPEISINTFRNFPARLFFFDDSTVRSYALILLFIFCSCFAL